jgi:hypothetical protein
VFEDSIPSGYGGALYLLSLFALNHLFNMAKALFIQFW